MGIPFTLFAASPGVYYAFENSDNVGKGIVVLLLIGSVFHQMQSQMLRASAMREARHV